jgi:predicted Fe-S protein YdhL (DUF1289 family)
MEKYCVNKCKLNKTTNKCTGCDRTIEEIKAKYSNTKISQKIVEDKLKAMADDKVA